MQMTTTIEAFSETRRAERGGGLLEVLVAVAVFGIVIGVLATVMSNLQAAAVRLGDDAEFESVAMTIKKAMSCQRTLAPHLNKAGVATCAGTPLNLLNANGGVLVAADGTNLGRWTARAKCGGEGVQVDLARLKPGKPINSMDPDDFELDKLTGVPAMWREATARSASAGFCHEFFRSARATGRRFLQGTQFVPGGMGSFTIPTDGWRPRFATCLTGTHAHFPGVWHNCYCSASATLNSSSVTFATSRDGTHPTACFVNYVIYGEL